MSTSAATPASTQARPNQFQLTSHSGPTKVSYAPPEGPISPIPKRTFSYNGPEGNLTFAESEITRLETPVGDLWSVVVKQTVAESITFAVFIPPISGDGSQHIDTYAVKARKSGSPVTAGAGVTYEEEHFKGHASFIKITAF